MRTQAFVIAALFAATKAVRLQFADGMMDSEIVNGQTSLAEGICDGPNGSNM
jgi:hypothetical protein